MFRHLYGVWQDFAAPDYWLLAPLDVFPEWEPLALYVPDGLAAATAEALERQTKDLLANGYQRLGLIRTFEQAGLDFQW